jgi:hypothetical protein
MLNCLVKNNIWIGYSSLQLALGICFSAQYLPSKRPCVITRKSNRFNSKLLGHTRIYHYNPLSSILLCIYVFLSKSTFWIPGISPTSCSYLEKLALQILFKQGRVRFYDDGMAGFIPNTFTWFHTLKILPTATGNATWSQTVRSPLFTDSVQVDVSLLKTIDPGIDCGFITVDSDYSIFIEANAMNINKLYTSFMNSPSAARINLYFAHTDKASVSCQFESSMRDHSVSNLHVFYSHEYHLLESLLMRILDSSSSCRIYTGCTSTLLIILLYASNKNSNNKLKVYYSPDYSHLPQDKIPQSRSFYNYIETFYSEQCIML